MISAYTEGKETEAGYFDSIDRDVSLAISNVVERFTSGDNVKYI